MGHVAAPHMVPAGGVVHVPLMLIGIADMHVRPAPHIDGIVRSQGLPAASWAVQRCIGEQNAPVAHVPATPMPAHDSPICGT